MIRVSSRCMNHLIWAKWWWKFSEEKEVVWRHGLKWVSCGGKRLRFEEGVKGSYLKWQVAQIPRWQVDWNEMPKLKVQSSAMATSRETCIATGKTLSTLSCNIEHTIQKIKVQSSARLHRENMRNMNNMKMLISPSINFSISNVKIFNFIFL